MIKLTDLNQNSSNSGLLSTPHKAIVTDNKDPEFKRRLKVKIPGVFESEAPIWFTPELPVGFGDSADAQRVEIPDIGSEVIVEFPHGDIHSGFYKSNWHLNAVPEEFREDYPNVYGFKDSSGTVFAVNKQKKTLLFDHCSGFKFEIDSDGGFTLTTPSKAKIDIAEALNVLAKLGKFDIPESKFDGELSDSTRNMSEDRAIYNSHVHSESMGQQTSNPIGSQ